MYYQDCDILQKEDVNVKFASFVRNGIWWNMNLLWSLPMRTIQAKKNFIGGTGKLIKNLVRIYPKLIKNFLKV